MTLMKSAGFIAATLAMSGMLPNLRTPSEKELDNSGIDLISEYNLILHKKSKLSANKRTMIVNRVNLAVVEGRFLRNEDGTVSRKVPPSPPEQSEQIKE